MNIHSELWRDGRYVGKPSFRRHRQALPRKYGFCFNLICGHNARAPKIPGCEDKCFLSLSAFRLRNAEIISTFQTT
jgi:hypothetical protein